MISGGREESSRMRGVEESNKKYVVEGRKPNKIFKKRWRQSEIYKGGFRV